MTFKWKSRSRRRLMHSKLPFSLQIRRKGIRGNSEGLTLNWVKIWYPNWQHEMYIWKNLNMLFSYPNPSFKGRKPKIYIRFSIRNTILNFCSLTMIRFRDICVFTRWAILLGVIFLPKISLSLNRNNMKTKKLTVLKPKPIFFSEKFLRVIFYTFFILLFFYPQSTLKVD